MGKSEKKKPAESGDKPRERKRLAKIEFTPEQRKIVAGLSAIGCSLDEIAATLRSSGLKISNRSLDVHLKKDELLRQQYDDGIATRNVKLRSRMFQQAMMMNGAGVHQAQFLAVNWLGMKRNPEITDEETAKNQAKHDQEAATARERVTAKLEALSKRLAGRVAGGDTDGIKKLPAPAQAEGN